MATYEQWVASGYDSSLEFDDEEMKEEDEVDFSRLNFSLGPETNMNVIDTTNESTELIGDLEVNFGWIHNQIRELYGDEREYDLNRELADYEQDQQFDLIAQYARTLRRYLNECRFDELAELTSNLLSDCANLYRIEW